MRFSLTSRLRNVFDPPHFLTRYVYRGETRVYDKRQNGVLKGFTTLPPRSAAVDIRFSPRRRRPRSGPSLVRRTENVETAVFNVNTPAVSYWRLVAAETKQGRPQRGRSSLLGKGIGGEFVGFKKKRLIISPISIETRTEINVINLKKNLCKKQKKKKTGNNDERDISRIIN